MRPRRDLMTTLRFLSVAFVFLLTGPPLSAAVQKAPGKKTATATAAPQPVSKVAPASALKALSGGEPADLIVEFSDTSVRRMAADLRASAGVALDTREIVEWKAAQYAAIKSAAMETISEGDIETLRDYSHLPMAFLRVRSRAALDRLMASKEVVGIYADQTHRKLLSESRPLIGQPSAAAAGHRGAGTTVAVLDGGVEYGRPAFGSCTSPGVPASCHVVAYQDFAEPDNRLDDPDLHGTNVSGIVLGVAPDSRIAGLDVFNVDSTNSSIVLAAVDWSIANKSTYNIVAMNLSLGGDTFDAPCTTGPYTAPFANARAAGILPIIASGNDGALNRLATPSCAPGAVSVGAVYDTNFGPYPGDCAESATAADKVACFSNSASFLTLLAPGAVITAAGVSQAGTSQASPHVAGGVAVLKAAFPSESVDQIVNRMTATGTPVTDSRNGILKPRLNLQAATGAASVPSSCPAQAIACPGTANGTLATGDCTTGLRNTGQFTDAYSFSGTLGQTLTIDMTSTFDTYLILVSPSGAVAAQNDDISTSGGNFNSRIANFTLDATGTWTIEATSYWAPGDPAGDGGAGAYNLAISGCITGGPSTCVAGLNTLCLAGGRFRVQVSWNVASQGTSGVGTALPLSADTGYFWFFNSANVELVVKVLDARTVNGKFWVFYGALSDVAYTITVTDTSTGAVRLYSNSQGNLASVADTAAF